MISYILASNSIFFNQTGQSSLIDQRPLCSRSRSRSPNSPSYAHSSKREQDFRAADDDKSSRSRSYSRSLSRTRSPTPGQESPEMDQEKLEERKRKGFPDIRKGYLTICSTTLWLGHVPKTVSEADISDAFGEFGTITSIDVR